MRRTAGILMYRKPASGLEVFLVHPGGPFWKNKDAGAWSIPKGLLDEGEDPLACARREFQEETGFAVDGDFVPLGTFRQPSGKEVLAWAVEGNCDAARVKSNLFELEWPPRSGRMQSFPEVDRGGWFSPDEAREKMLAGQRPILEWLLEMCDKPGPRKPGKP
jgi:predicted NUDIX family NTP pyrophosphohydrolase